MDREIAMTLCVQQAAAGAGSISLFGGDPGGLFAYLR